MKRRNENGAVSLFIVIFTALIVTVVTVSFTQLMIANQQQATSNDLSQRAYDSAMAGVEDAKRLLVLNTECSQGKITQNCSTYTKAISNAACDTIQAAQLGKTTTDGTQNSETQVGTQSDNQGYTCVIINEDTPSYTGTLSTSSSAVVPLKGTTPFDTIRVSWFSQTDLNGSAFSVPSTSPTQLPPASSWSPSNPSILRLQYIPGNKPISSLDTNASTRTAFLYPSSSLGGLSSASFAISSLPQPISCTDPSTNANGYACVATLSVPGGATSSAFLQVASMYNSASFQVELLRGSTVVSFNGVQPTVDSTGRASDVFRRVLAHVTVANGVTLPYPNATLDVGNNLCKDFFITGNVADYNGGNCDQTKTN